MTYKPLPESLTIKDSKVHGLGLFAKQDIVKGVTLGISHVHNEDFENNYVRTPLGGFINHSDNANAKLLKVNNNLLLTTKRFIQKGEEIFTTYNLYKIKDGI
jgi:SET domain-containing protein